MELRSEVVMPMRVLALRHVGPYPELPHTWEKFLAAIGPLNLMGHGNLYLSIYHDDPMTVPPEKLRSDAGVTVNVSFDNVPEGLHLVEIQGGNYVCWSYVGPYTGVGDAWTKFSAELFLRETHMPRQDVCFEIYVNDPCKVPPEELRTDLYFPVV